MSKRDLSVGDCGELATHLSSVIVCAITGPSDRLCVVWTLRLDMKACARRGLVGSEAAAPRRGLFRRFLTQVRQASMNGQCDKTKVVIGVNLQNEDRSSLQCCAGRHYKNDERVNRVSPLQGEHSNFLVHNKPWKLLYCERCQVIMQRDLSAAYNIAIKAAWKRLYGLNLATKECPQCLQRWSGRT